MTSRPGTGLGSRLAILNAAVVGAWGEPAAEPVPGFIESAFNPTVFELCRRLMSTSVTRPDAMAIVLGSLHGDTTTADVASQRLLRGQRRNPLLFYQSVPSSILGYVSAMFGITGPMLTLSGNDDVFEQSLRLAAVLLAGGDMRSILLLSVAVPATKRVEVLYRECGYQIPSDAPQAYGFGLEIAAAEHHESSRAVLVLGPAGVDIEVPSGTGQNARRCALRELFAAELLAPLPPDVRECASACAVDRPPHRIVPTED